MPEYVYDEAFETRLEHVLREIGNEAVLPFDPYETTQLVISKSRIGGVPITAIPAAQMAQHPGPPAPEAPYASASPYASGPPMAPPMAPPVLPPPGPPPGYYDEPLPSESRRWPLLVALGLLIAALVFAGFATGFIKLPSNFGITIGTPAPVPTSTHTTVPTVTSEPTAEPTPKKTRKPRRTQRPRRTDAPIVTTEPQPTLAPTEPPTIEPVQPTPEPAVTQAAGASPI